MKSAILALALALALGGCYGALRTPSPFYTEWDASTGHGANCYEDVPGGGVRCLRY